jgi:hypothetical protein
LAGSLAMQSPCGLTIDLAGPMTGGRHDRQILKKIKLLSRWMAANVAAGWAAQLIATASIYADAGYHSSPALQGAYHRQQGALAGCCEEAPQSRHVCRAYIRRVAGGGFQRVLALCALAFLCLQTWAAVGEDARREDVRRRRDMILSNANYCSLRAARHRF